MASNESPQFWSKYFKQKGGYLRQQLQQQK